MPEVLSLLNLPWEDVICKKILGYLTIKEVYRLKCTCKDFTEITELYMKYFCRNLDFTVVGGEKKFNSVIFLLICRDKTNILQLNCKNCKEWLRDEHLTLLNNNSHMTDLCITECYGISDLTFVSISENLPGLKNLDLSYCRELSDEALIQIGKGLHQLLSLDVSGCWKVNDSSIETVAINNPCLQILRTKSCYAITDIAITAVAKNCYELKELDIQGCWRVKDPSIIAIREYCKQLKSLYVKECTGVTEISLARMRPKGILLDIEKPVYRGYAGMPLMNRMPLIQI